MRDFNPTAVEGLARQIYVASFGATGLPTDAASCEERARRAVAAAESYFEATIEINEAIAKDWRMLFGLPERS